MKTVNLFFILFILSFILSCSKDDGMLEKNTLATAETRSNDPGNVASGPNETVLGNILQNPYDIVNVNQAHQQIYGAAGNLQPSHYYIKFIPAAGEDITDIEQFEEAYDYEFDSQPIHYEVLYEGDEDYVDPSVPQTGGFSPEYGAITALDYLQGKLPDVPHQVLNVMNIPEYESKLTFTAFVLSGNERFYEAIDGLCHPDCPTWPECLDDPTLTCDLDPTLTQSLTTTDPYSSETRMNFPEYILDRQLGYNGDIGGGVVQGVETPPMIECPPGCIPKLIRSDLNPGPIPTYEWICDCPPVGGDGEGGGDDDGPSNGLAQKCGCDVYIDDRKPGGKIILEDTELGDEGVRRIKVKTTRHYWGFIWKNTDTDDEGCWKINKRYNIKRAKVKAVFKDRVSDRLLIKSIRGLRIWNTFLKPVKHKWRLKRSDKNWNSLCLRIENSNDNNSRNEQTFVAATTNNAIHEFADDHTTIGSGLDDTNLRILLHTWGGSASAPMLHYYPNLSLAELHSYQDLSRTLWGLFDLDVSIAFPSFAEVELIWKSIQPDITLPFGGSLWIDDEGFDHSDIIKLTIYHEMVHVAQAGQFGPIWWDDYVNYILTVGVLAGQASPYGNGDLSGAGMAELTEGMAESFGLLFADQQYELNHSQGDPNFRQFFRYINQAERLLFSNDIELPAGTTFIPYGLYFDLFDDSIFPISANEPVSPVSGIAIPDNITGFTFQQQLEALNPEIESVQQFRDNLWDIHGSNNNVVQSSYIELFDQYGF